MLHGLVQGAALEAAAIRALQGDDIKAFGAQFGRYGTRERRRLVGAVIEDLYVQLVSGPIESGGRLDTPAQYRPLVEGRDLDDNMRQFRVRRQRRREQVLLALQSLGAQSVIEHHHVKQAADEGRQQHAASEEDCAKKQRQRVDDDHPCVRPPSWACG